METFLYQELIANEAFLSKIDISLLDADVNITKIHIIVIAQLHKAIMEQASVIKMPVIANPGMNLSKVYSTIVYLQ